MQPGRIYINGRGHCSAVERPVFGAVDYQNLLSNSNGGMPHLGVPPIQFSECLHGTNSGCGAPYTDPDTGYTSTGCPTSFPHLLRKVRRLLPQ